MNTTKVILDEDGMGTISLFADNIPAGRMEIAIKDRVLTAFHTETEPEFSGRGFGKILLEKLVSYARENTLKVVPLCPYVYAQFKRYPESYADVWFKKQ